METINNGMEIDQQEGSIKVLTQVLADQHVLYVKLRNFHWNLKGPRFHDLHKMFEEQYKELEIAIDETAERIRSLGGTSPGSMDEFLDKASLKEEHGELIPGDRATELLISDNNRVSCFLRENIDKCEDEYNDVGTADFLTGLLLKHEQNAWMLRSMREA